MALPADALQTAGVWTKSMTNKGQFTLVAETVFRVYRD
jgi:hypothetical protein